MAPPKKQKRTRGPALTTVREEGPSSPSTSAPTRRSLSRLVTPIDKEAEALMMAEEFVNDPQSDAETEMTEEDMMSDNVRRLRIRGGSQASTIAEDREMSHERRMRRNVVNAIRQAFQARGEINKELSVSTQKLLIAYKMALPDPPRRPKDISDKFFEELDIRLGMMIEELSVVEHRAQVFKIVALATMEELKRNNNSAFLDFLIGFLKKWSLSTNVDARINSSSLIGYIFETSASKLPERADKFAGLSLTASEDLFLMLRKALFDREYSARVPAIRALGTLQKFTIPSMWKDEARESSPRELLIRSFRDVAWECRLTAMQCIGIHESEVVITSDIIQYEKNLKVRLAALDKFGDLRPSRNVRVKVQLLDVVLKDHDVAIRDQAKKTLQKWIESIAQKWSIIKNPPKKDKDVVAVDHFNEPLDDPEKTGSSKGYILAAGALQMLWLNDCADTAESHAIIKKLTQHLLDVVRHLYMCHMEPINAFAETLAAEIRDHKNDTLMIISKSNIGNILEQNEMFPLMHDTQTNRSMVFFWRCIVEYMVERKRNEGDKLNALSRFVCPLKTLTEHFQVVQERLKRLETSTELEDTDDINKLYILQMSIVENFLIVMRHAPRDQAGLDAYKAMLLNMLANPCYQKKIIDIIIFDLTEFYEDCPDDLLSKVFAMSNELKQKFRGGKIPHINENTVLIGEKKVLAQGLDGPRRSSSSFNGTKAAELHELMIINAIMKSNLLDKWDQVYADRYNKMFKKNLASKDLDRRILALECVGLVGMTNLEQAESGLGEILSNFSKEEEEVQSVILNILCDLAIFHSIEEVDAIMAKYMTRENTDLLSVLIDIVVTEEPNRESELLLKAVEGLSKVLLNRSSDDSQVKWQNAVSSLMFRASYRILDRFAAKIRSVIIVMLKFFCSLKRANQVLMISSFQRFFEMWLCTSTPELLCGEDLSQMMPKLKRCASTYTALTRHSILPPEEQKLEPVHVALVNDVFAELATRPDAMSTDYYLYTLQTVEITAFSHDTLTRMYKDMDTYIGLHEVDQDRHRYHELVRFRKKLMKHLGINEDEEEERAAAAARSESRAGRAHNRAKKAAEEAAASEEAEGDESEGEEAPEAAEEVEVEAEEAPEEPEEEEPEEEIARPPRKLRAQRSAPASAQKKKKAEQDPIDLLASPQRNPRKPPSRQNTGTRPTAPASATRAAPPRSARKLRSDK